MNPLTALFDSIERLITEHGSAATQEKHIALLKEQFFVLQRENEILTKENRILVAKNQSLESENQNLKQENVNLKKIIEEMTHGLPPCSASSAESEISRAKKIRRQLKGQ